MCYLTVIQQLHLVLEFDWLRGPSSNAIFCQYQHGNRFTVSITSLEFLTVSIMVKEQTLYNCTNTTVFVSQLYKFLGSNLVVKFRIYGSFIKTVVEECLFIVDCMKDTRLCVNEQGSMWDRRHRKCQSCPRGVFCHRGQWLNSPCPVSDFTTKGHRLIRRVLKKAT